MLHNLPNYFEKLKSRAPRSLQMFAENESKSVISRRNDSLSFAFGAVQNDAKFENDLVKCLLVRFEES